MVAPAFRSHIALAARAGRKGSGVVEVAIDGLGKAAGCGAGGRAGPDQVAEPAAWQVTALRAGMIAAALGNGTEGGVEPAEESGYLGGSVRRGVGMVRVEIRDPGMLPASAGVSDGRAVGVHDGHAPAGPRVTGSGASDVARLIRVEQAPRARLGGSCRPA